MQVLGLDLEIAEVGKIFGALDSDFGQDFTENGLESLQVPVLVNASVNDSRVEHLLGLQRQKIAQVVHLVKLSVVCEVFADIVGKELLGKQVDSVCEFCGQFFVLLGANEAKFDLVHKAAHRREGQWFCQISCILFHFCHFKVGVRLYISVQSMDCLLVRTFKFVECSCVCVSLQVLLSNQDLTFKLIINSHHTISI